VPASSLLVITITPDPAFGDSFAPMGAGLLNGGDVDPERVPAPRYRLGLSPLPGPKGISMMNG
jgi:hypothetical protein